MLRYAVVFFIVALFLALFGFHIIAEGTGIIAGACVIARMMFFMFITLSVISLIWGLLKNYKKEF